MSRVSSTAMAGRFSMMPNLTSLTLYRKNALDVVVAQGDIPNVEKRQTATGGDRPSLDGAGLGPDTITVHIWRSQLPPTITEPREDDVVLVDGNYWRIVSATLELADARYRCPCVRTDAP